MTRRSRWGALVGGLLAVIGAASCAELGLPVERDAAEAGAAESAERGASEGGAESEAAGLRTVLPDVTVRSYGRVVWRGDVDLGPTIERIRAGERHSHRNDGSVFQNRERRLPIKPRGWYREYVHPTPGIRGAGPQRIVVGQGGEWYYTPDHYGSFVRLNR